MLIPPRSKHQNEDLRLAWQERFAEDGVDGLRDKMRPSRILPSDNIDSHTNQPMLSNHVSIKLARPVRDHVES